MNLTCLTAVKYHTPAGLVPGKILCDRSPEEGNT